MIFPPVMQRDRGIGGHRDPAARPANQFDWVGWLAIDAFEERSINSEKVRF